MISTSSIDESQHTRKSARAIRGDLGQKTLQPRPDRFSNFRFSEVERARQIAAKRGATEIVSTQAQLRPAGWAVRVRKIKYCWTKCEKPPCITLSTSIYLRNLKLRSSSGA